MMFQRPGRDQHEPFFKNLKLHFRSCRIVKESEQLTRSSFSPQISQGYVVIVQLPTGKSEKREPASQIEMNAEKLILSRSFDDQGPGLGTRNASFRCPAASKLDNELYRPHGQDPLPRVRYNVAPPIPEESDEFGKRFFRDVVLKENRRRRLRAISIKNVCDCRSHIASITRWVSRKQASDLKNNRPLQANCAFP